MQDQVCITALADKGLVAAEYWRPQVAAGRCAGGVRLTGGRHCEVERLNRVVANVLRQQVNEAVGIAIDTYRFLQVFGCHTHELEVADVLLNNSADIEQPVRRVERERNSALDTNIAVNTPAANQHIHQAAGVREERLAFAERRFIQEVRLESVANIEG